jgi:hypothetical protein
MTAKLDITLARSAPDTYRQQFLRFDPEQRMAHLQLLDAEGLRAHTKATGETSTWWLSLKLGRDLIPSEVESGIAHKRRTFRFEPGQSFEAWFRSQFDFIEKAGVVAGPCMLSMPHQFGLDEARPMLLKLLRVSLPSVDWHPTLITLNTVGYSDRGEPPDPSTSMRVWGKVRSPAFAKLGSVPFQSTVSMLQPMDAEAWRALLGALARQLGIEIREN